MATTTPRRRTVSASDPKVGMTLDDVAEFVAEMMGRFEMPGDTPVRCAGLIEFDPDGPRVSRLTADPGARK